MPYCPSCHFEYRSGVTRCPDCGSILVPDLPKAPESPPAGDWVVVYTARDKMEANIVCGVLAEESVAVPQHWEERAKAILKERLEGGTQWDWPDNG